jgi:hypothetical protein
MTILHHIHFDIPRIYEFCRYDTTCLHFANIFKGNKPIGNWLPNSTHKHAEHNALRMLKTQKYRKNHHLTLVVLRFDRSFENLRISKPCTRCIELLKNNDIKTIVYSDNNGNLIKEDISQIVHRPSSMSSNIPIHGRVISYSKFKEQ